MGRVQQRSHRGGHRAALARNACTLAHSTNGTEGRTAASASAARSSDSWAEVCPGSNESAGRTKSTQTRPGNPYLKAALGTAALSIAASRGTFLAAKYKRLAARRGGKKALVAIEHTILTAIWSMATTGAYYDDPGPDYYLRHNPDRARRNAIRQLERLGSTVTLTEAAQTA